MPTAAKLAAALLFGALAWAASLLAEAQAPEGTDLGRFAEVNLLVGAVAGWRVAGGRAGATARADAAHGATAAAVTAVGALVIHSLRIMIRRSLRRMYDGPVEALLAAVEIALRQAAALGTPAVAATLLGGGVAAGLLAGWVGRRLA